MKPGLVLPICLVMRHNNHYNKALMHKKTCLHLLTKTYCLLYKKLPPSSCNCNNPDTLDVANKPIKDKAMHNTYRSHIPSQDLQSGSHALRIGGRLPQCMSFLVHHPPTQAPPLYSPASKHLSSVFCCTLGRAPRLMAFSAIKSDAHILHQYSAAALSTINTANRHCLSACFH